MAKLNLQLRAIRKEDAAAIATLANNIKIANNVRDALPHPYGLKDAEFFIGLTEKEDPQETFGIFCDGEFCGMIGLILQNDVYRKSAELGYWIGEPFWGRGIATSAVEKILDYGFQKLELERIFASAFEFNSASMRVLEKNGFVKEGVARKAVLKNGQFYDEHRFGKLKGE